MSASEIGFLNKMLRVPQCGARKGKTGVMAQGGAAIKCARLNSNKIEMLFPIAGQITYRTVASIVLEEFCSESTTS